ncbi:hypothetical protein JCM11641_002171 [Rhodosporidiobolus odoratus]
MLVRSLLMVLAATGGTVNAAAATKILVPLYEWSEDCWPELQAAAANNPTASYLSIINPNSGPILDTSDPSLYCIPVLRQRIPNLTLIGYVRTGYYSRPASEVEADVAIYQSWSGLNVSAGGVKGTSKVDGIFFDETPNFVDSLNGLTTYSGYAKAARSAFGAKTSTVVFNPGTYANSRLYTFADLVVAYEDSYQNYAAAKPPPANVASKSAIMIHTFPSASRVLQISLRRLLGTYGAVYIATNDIAQEDVYKRFGDNWNDFVKYVAALQKSSTTKARRALRL